MSDTPQHIKGIQLKLWLEKTQCGRLYQTIVEIEAMRIVLREVKIKMNLPLEELDPVRENLSKKNLIKPTSI